MKQARRAHPRHEDGHQSQLEMVMRFGQPVVVPALPVGYRLRQIEAKDRSAYESLFLTAWDEDPEFAETMSQSLPQGCFGIEFLSSGDLVATCVALSGSWDRHARTGALGWLVTDPDHTNRGLGTIVAGSVTNRLLAEGYSEPWLGTEDPRLQAIAIYLKLGWRPYIYGPDMIARWRTIITKLGKPAGLETEFVYPRTL